MKEQDLSYWSRANADLLADWPKDADGRPEQAQRIATVGDMGGDADLMLAMLKGYGIPAFKDGTQGRVILGFAGPTVDLYVPASVAEDAKVLLTPPQDGETDASEQGE